MRTTWGLMSQVWSGTQFTIGELVSNDDFLTMTSNVVVKNMCYNNDLSICSLK